MKQIERFDDNVKKLLGSDLDTLTDTTEGIIKIANRLLEKKMDFELMVFSAFVIKQSFLAKSSCSKEFYSILSTWTGFEITEEILLKNENTLSGGNDEKMIDSFFYKPHFQSFYENTLLLAFHHLTTNRSYKLLLACQICAKQRDLSQSILIDKLIKFVESCLSVSEYYSVVDFYSKYLHNDLIFSFMKEIISAIYTYQPPMLLPLYWYYDYLGQNEMIDILSPYLKHTSKKVNKLYVTFSKGGYVPLIETLSIDIIKAKYDKLVNITEESFEPSFSKALGSASQHTLVFVCLYAKNKGDIEREATALSYLLMRNKSAKLLDRMSKITEFTVPIELATIPLEKRGEWVMHRLNMCNNLFTDRGNDNKYFISCARSAFKVRPFEWRVLRALIKVEASENEEEIRNMLYSAISKINSKILLRKLLEHAILLKSQFTCRLILLRMFILSYMKGIMVTLATGLAKSDLEKADDMLIVLVVECLVFYKQYADVAFLSINVSEYEFHATFHNEIYIATLQPVRVVWFVLTLCKGTLITS